MKAIFLSVLALGAMTLPAQASEIKRSCLAKVVSAVNKHHTLAEGAAYALRVLYAGHFGAALLVGHSDETDPTDYVVSVDLTKNCQIKSIVYAEEAGHVTEYSAEERDLVSELFLEEKALELIQKVPSSSYDNRVLCIQGQKVTAVVPMTHWAKNDRKTATGDLYEFPKKITSGEAAIEISGSEQTLLSGSVDNGFYLVSGSVNGKPADICLQEVKPLLESVKMK